MIVCLIWVTIILTVHFAASKKHPDDDDSCPKVVKYDFDALSIRWNPTFCNKGNDNKVICESLFNFVIINLIKVMQESWPNLLKGKPVDSLWRHEWMKHGTCSSIGIKEGQFGYFNRTLHLFDEYPIQEWLEKAGIKPTEPEKELAYNKSAVYEAIKSQLGHRTALFCKKKFRSKILIDTLFICFQYPKFRLYDCPLRDRCDEKVILPKTRQREEA
ncbi:uncharacterized protein LOC141851361 [Brevipalpus obovatus]|uniref:uncharacterized protein LOC141851361 n=1 Tax=Brevipalpus obovatus TaxID=246614 RepID=UPI003D9EF847